MFYSHSFIIIRLIGMKFRRINNHFMSSLCQAYRNIFSKLFKTSVIVWNASSTDKCNLHIYIILSNFQNEI